MLPVPSDPGARPWRTPEITFHPPLNVLAGLVVSTLPSVGKSADEMGDVLPLPTFSRAGPAMLALRMSVRAGGLSAVALNTLPAIELMSRLDGVRTLMAPATVVV